MTNQVEREESNGIRSKRHRTFSEEGGMVWWGKTRMTQKRRIGIPQDGEARSMLVMVGVLVSFRYGSQLDGPPMHPCSVIQYQNLWRQSVTL